MKSKDGETQNVTPMTAQTTYDLRQLVWAGANFTLVAGVTSSAVVAIQSPIKSMLVSLTQGAGVFPKYSGGTLGLMRALYAGTGASMTSSYLRTGYVTGTRNSVPKEMIEAKEVKEEEAIAQVHAVNKVGYVASAALGDILVTQVSESLSQLRKVNGLLPKDFKWYGANNLRHLMTGGFAPRYVGGLVNFASLCVIEEKIAQGLPMSDGPAKHFASGALSGMGAAFFAYPCALVKDYTLVQSSVDANGQLKTKSTLSVLRDLSGSFVKNPKEAAKAFASNAAKQLPMRMGLTGAIFATVSGVGEALGKEPLEPVAKCANVSVARVSASFFSQSRKEQKTVVSEQTETLSSQSLEEKKELERIVLTSFLP